MPDGARGRGNEEPVRYGIGFATPLADRPEASYERSVDMASERKHNVNDPDLNPDRNPDPITGAPGSHPVGTGIGAAGGGAAGAAIGAAVSGPAAPAGAVVGAVAGGLAGKGAAEAVNPTAEDEYWRTNYTSRPYYENSYTYDDDYRPA